MNRAVGANAALVSARNALAAVAAPPAGLMDLLTAATSLLADPVNPGAPPNVFGPLLDPNERVAVDGAFKTRGLRNIELTAPYFHNGGDRTLLDVVNFYNRGGNFPEFNQDNLDPNIVRLALTDAEKDALVAFLLALTDERVRHEAAPFDHPSLHVFDGHPCTSRTVRACNDILAAARTTINGVPVASDVTFEFAETGAAGTMTPQKTFDQVLGGALLP
jgi:hypothetical protein